MSEAVANNPSEAAVINPSPDAVSTSAPTNKSNKSYFSKLFTGRLNFSGFILGMLANSIVSAILY